MGLAPYSSAYHAKKTCEIFDKTVRVEKTKFKNTTKRWAHSYGLYMKKTLYKHRFDAVAFALQNMVEKTTTAWIQNCIKEYDINDIMVCGGFFMNVRANQRISEMDEVESFFAVPSGGDESSAIGAAMLGYIDLCMEDGIDPKIEEITDIYFGPSYNYEIDDFVKKTDKKRYKIEYHSDSDKAVGEMLSQGKVIARFNDRMEFGARSLGNRSILADPRDTRVITEINSQIKQRDFWMPFAPSIIREDAKKLLDMLHKNVNDQYMILSFNTTDTGKEVLRAALHQSDFTARPQVVEKGWNPRYHSLIKSFKKETGFGGILNTSFNLHGEPIVCTPQDALSTLERSGLKYLMMGDYIIEKK
ncbi:MAG: carbamoyltransferase C-terminal domain-containing protein [Candidatus Aenigmarchaeota archaeon]|nr:carbamoyltransferase C-terminal domain-containing protein [Candidatus Aenigmarchaeota archaeon]MDI6722055.1 carbamoyltransferase C-terminal domain-containing protein [Candidatus Aenigmarchaeota archaeon]